MAQDMRANAVELATSSVRYASTGKAAGLTNPTGVSYEPQEHF